MIHQVDTPDDPRIAAYLSVGHPDRLRASGLFVAEGRLVVRRPIMLRIPMAVDVDSENVVVAAGIALPSLAA